MKPKLLILLLSVIVIGSCKNKDDEIRQLLNSNKVTEIIEGAREAGKTGNKKYIPLLLQNIANPSVSTSLKYKGFSVYTEKMYALEEITHVKPPRDYSGILRSPDSVNIKFYIQYLRNNNNQK